MWITNGGSRGDWDSDSDADWGKRDREIRDMLQSEWCMDGVNVSKCLTKSIPTCV